MKILTQGRWLWTRTIGSTIFGEAVDSLIFFPLAFYGTGEIANDLLPKLMLARAMGGELSVESAPGQGARFILDLPADKAASTETL